MDLSEPADLSIDPGDPRTGGHIVNTASVAAFEMGAPTMAPYAALKCAVLGLSESLAFELRATDARGVASGAGCRAHSDHRRGAEPTSRCSVAGA